MIYFHAFLFPIISRGNLDGVRSGKRSADRLRPERRTWGDKELVADIYQSRGTELFEKGKLREALGNYDMALKLNPEYEKAELNRAILLDRMKTQG